MAFIKRPKRQILRRLPPNLSRVNPENARLIEWAKVRGYEVRAKSPYLLSIWRLTGDGKRYVGLPRSATKAREMIEKDIVEQRGKKR